MARPCEACREDASLFYIWMDGHDNHVWSYCKSCWAGRAFKSQKRTVKDYTVFMDSGSTRVFYSLEEAQIALVKRSL